MREQIVAALIVGSVVILLGFASGLGIEPARVSQPARVPSTSTRPAPGAGQTQTISPPLAAAAPPVAYVVEPASPPDVASPAPTPPVTVTPPATSSASPPPTTTTTATSPAPSVPTCPADLLTTVLDTLLSSRPAAGGSGLFGFGALLKTVASVTSQVSALLTLQPEQLLARLNDTLALGGAAPSCAAEVAAALPLIADGRTVRSAVEAAAK
jgi:hypothetical protein